MADQKTDIYFDEWIEREAVAERMIPLIGKLYREHGAPQSTFCRCIDTPAASWAKS